MFSSQKPTIWDLGVTFSILAAVAVTLRFQARRINGQKFKSDDWSIIVAQVW
jgi:hypothetical protein